MAELSWPKRGDLVAGHSVYVYFNGRLPAIPAEVTEVSKSEASVTVQLNTLNLLLGLPKHAVFTWRKSNGTYTEKGDKAGRGGALVLRHVQQRKKGAKRG